MDRDQFNSLLKKSNLTKREFCDLMDLNYNTINTWGSSKIKIPKWVESWLNNYIKAKDMDQIINAVRPYIENIEGEKQR